MRAVWFVVCTVSCALFALPVAADPCGMVPPMTWVPQDADINVSAVPIERAGAQKTYVAFGDGIESMVLRPGFVGKVDEFGMLIPFPSPPAIRKVEESIFSHIGAAVDPPEVVVRINPPIQTWGATGGVRSSKADAPVALSEASRFVPQDRLAEPSLSYDVVNVVKQEAVGMYDVAVLEAGSTEALKRWMKENKFRYPDGMEAVTEEYVAGRWVFVAIKTQVGQKGGVNPRPGMKSVNPNLPAGSTFSGHVQAMGFRFRVAQPVVPMRLSAFNKGETRNIVYILADEGQHIEKIPQKFVMRQVPGKKLRRNTTRPLPLKVINGTERDIPTHQRPTVDLQRKPEPHNGFAKELFLSDLMAFHEKKLILEAEEIEKGMEAISDRLDLAPDVASALHDQFASSARAELESVGMKKLDKMTLTIVDGEFARETIAKHNLAFAPFTMEAKKNSPRRYNARTLKKLAAAETTPRGAALASTAAVDWAEEDLGWLWPFQD